MIEAERILAGLGGAANVVDIQACVTRVRCEVRDRAKVDESALTAAGAMGVITTDGIVHVVVGSQSDALVDDIEDLM